MAPPPIATADAPAPMACTAVVVPYAVVRPYSKFAFVVDTFGFAVPLSVALVTPTLVAEPVTVVGAQAAVVNVPSEPGVVPTAFVAVARKWYVVLQVRP